MTNKQIIDFAILYFRMPIEIAQDNLSMIKIIHNQILKQWERRNSVSIQDSDTIEEIK